MARMLGRHRHLMSCKNPQCSFCAEDGATRWRKRIEARELDREIAEAAAEYGDESREWAELSTGVAEEW